MGRSFWHPSGLGHALPIQPLLWQDLVATFLSLRVLLDSLSGHDPSTRSGFRVVAVMVIQLGAFRATTSSLIGGCVAWVSSSLAFCSSFLLELAGRRLRPVGTAAGCVV